MPEKYPLKYLKFYESHGAVVARQRERESSGVLNRDEALSSSVCANNVWAKT